MSHVLFRYEKKKSEVQADFLWVKLVLPFFLSLTVTAVVEMIYYYVAQGFITAA